MPEEKTVHHSFKINYNRIVRELTTEASLKPPEILVGDDESLWIKLKAVWDTGATHTVITHRVARLLDLKPTGKVTVFGINSQAIVNRYMVDIGLPNKIIFRNFEVTESDLNSEEIDILVGMDIIQQGDFAIANAGGKTVFTFNYPPKNPTLDIREIQGKIDFRDDYDYKEMRK